MTMKKCYIAVMAAGLLLMSGCANDGQKQSRLSDTKLMREFKNPSNEWRGKPFWAWNGKLDKEELLRQVDAMKDMGFGGYFMHSRVGLQTEYLGDEWFQLTNDVADYGKRLGMENYLYDEDRWPSGTAGGYVTKNPDFRMNFVTLKVVPRAQYEWADTLLAAFSCQLDGTSFTQLQRLQPGEKATAGNSVLAFFREKAPNSDFVNGFSYVDAMNPEATKKYIELTHEAYANKCEGRVGSSIVGIFTDEPHRGPLFTNFSNDSKNRPYMCPWTDKFPEEYKKRFGEDIVDQLPYLFLHPEGKNYHKVKWQYVEMGEELFLNNFMKPLYDWCSEHNMAFTGHLLHEDNFVSQVTMQGSLMRSYELMHIPGMDMLTQDSRKYWVAKQLSSVGHQLGKKRLLSELYGATGWQMTFEDYKQVGDWQALFGINVRCPHLSWYTMEGEAKRDYPASIFYQSGWYKDFKFVEDYYARLGMLMAQGKPQTDVLVISPIESVFAQVSVDAFTDLTPQSPIIAEIENRYFDLFSWLQSQKIDFDYGDEEMMSRLASVQKDEDGTTVLRVGQADYRTVFVGNMATMRTSTLNLIKDFMEQGGKVVLAGDAPTMVDVEESDQPKTLLASAVKADYEKESIGKAILPLIRPVVTVRDSLGKNIDDIFCQVRQDGDRTLYVLMNMSGDDDFGEVTVSLPANGKLSEWNCRNGEVYAIDAAQEENDGLTFKTEFATLQEHVFMVSKHTIAKQQLPAKGVAGLAYVFPEEYAYELNEPNVLPLDWVYYTVGGKRSSSLVEVIHADKAIRQQLGLKPRGGEMLQPWFFAKFVNADKKEYGEIQLEFPFEIECLPDSDVFLCIETPQIFQISLNDQVVEQQIEGWWIDPCYKRIKMNGLKEGQNKVTLKTVFTEDMNIETLYLTGSFGVNVTPVPSPAQAQGQKVGTHEQPAQCCYVKPVMTKLPEKLHVGDVVPQGLPFYSGTISYKVTGIPEMGDGLRRQIVFADYEAACIRVREAEELQTVAFTPYVAQIGNVDAEGVMWLDMVLTRRNTFGPLHFLPARNWAYYPDLYVATPEMGYTDSYVLLPTGLLDKPYIENITQQ